MQGLKTRDYPAHAVTVTIIGIERKPVFWGDSLFAIACCSRATAREAPSGYCGATLTMIGG